jgi:hypothetical protein
MYDSVSFLVVSFLLFTITNEVIWWNFKFFFIQYARHSALLGGVHRPSGVIGTSTNTKNKISFAALNWI